ncbi:MAG: hypothetical protein GVY35_06025 [Bacteroidetes bacterium]|jgi:hypothetical protein|nr:hypothetical protein [Bacteroidota bacterium]
MADSNGKTSSHDEYRRTRDTFNKMNVEQQATFLVEATASMVARGVEEAGRAVADGLSDVFGARKQAKRRSEPRRGPGPAEPETAQQRRPRGGTSDAA